MIFFILELCITKLFWDSIGKVSEMSETFFVIPPSISTSRNFPDKESDIYPTYKST